MVGVSFNPPSNLSPTRAWCVFSRGVLMVYVLCQVAFRRVHAFHPPAVRTPLALLCLCNPTPLRYWVFNMFQA